MKKQLFILTFLLSSIVLFSQNCDCALNFEFLQAKIEKDYAGFTDKVNETTISDYERHTDAFRKHAAEINTSHRCALLLEQWLTFFQDKHLSINLEANYYWAFKPIDSNALLFRIPSFSWRSKTFIDSLIRTNYELITKTPILIIDLRGNGGGIDYSYQNLLQFLYTQPYESKGVEWLASDGNIEFFEHALETGDIRKGHEEEVKNQIKLMKENRNGFVLLDSIEIIQRDTVLQYPQKIGLIVNDFCASSCEQFVLAGKNSSKTTVFGTNTLGVLDYSNSVPIDLPMENASLRYPMTRSQRLPEYPIDNIGIAPDVRINLPDNLNVKDEIDDWVLFAKDYLERGLGNK